MLADYDSDAMPRRIEDADSDDDAHREDEAMIAATKEASGHCLSLKVLGSYPRAANVL